MAKKYSNMGLNNGVPKQVLTTEQALALARENGRNHPSMRLSLVEKELMSLNAQAQKSSKPNPND